VRDLLHAVSDTLGVYATYFERKVAEVQANHAAEAPVRQPEDSIDLLVLPPALAGHVRVERFGSLSAALAGAPLYSPLCLEEYLPLPHEKGKRQAAVQALLAGGKLRHPTSLFVHRPGGGKPNRYFAWRVGDELNHTQQAQAMQSCKEQVRCHAERAPASAVLQLALPTGQRRACAWLSIAAACAACAAAHWRTRLHCH
jgi:hypothetical protein